MEGLIESARVIASSETVFAFLFILTILFVSRKAMEIYKEASNSGARREQYIFDLHQKREIHMQEIIHVNRQDSATREAKLMEKIDASNTHQAKIATTLDNINLKLDKMDDNFQNVWIEIHQIKDKKGDEVK